MLGGLLGGLIGGAARRSMPRSPLSGGSRILSGLSDQPEEGRRRPNPVMPRPTLGQTGKQADQPDIEIGKPVMGTQEQEQPSISQTTMRMGPESTQQVQESRPPSGPFSQPERPIEPPRPQPEPSQPEQAPEEEQPPIFEEQQPMEIDKIDVTQGVQEPEIEQKTQELPPSRYTPTPNALPAVHPRADTGSNDQIQIPDMGYGFKRPEGVEEYAAKFTYRRR
jgi:hypothetical protein